MTDHLKRLITRHEGVSRHAYRCPAGHLTIGIGRNIDRDGGGLGLSDDEIEFLLQNDITRARRELDRAFPWFQALDEVRQAAMIDLHINLGLPRLRMFIRALHAMDARQYERAADEFQDSQWFRQVGDRGPRIVNMIRTGEWPND